MLKFFTVKEVPFVTWSSPHPFSFRPRTSTLAILCIGLAIFGLGESLLIVAALGVSPWTVLAQGVSNLSGLTIGWATFLVSLLVLFSWIPLRQLPGLGTLLNAVIISAAIGFSVPWLPTPELMSLRLLEVIGGIFCVGLGSGMYLMAHLGAGPRDGLMTGLQRLSQLPIAWVRMGIELSVVAAGWLLGGSVGIGTVLFAFGIGPSVALGITLVTAISVSFGSITVTTAAPESES